MKIQDININPPEEIKQKIEKVRTKQQNYFEFHHRLKDGSIRDVEVFSSNIQAKGKDFLHSLVHDITTRKQAEQALREREGLLSSIYRAAPTGIGVVSNRTLLTVNDRICEMTGYSRESLIGKSARILYPDDADFDFVGREKYRQITKSGTGTVETHWQRRDGQVIDVLMSSTPINPQDLAAGVTFTALDITERKQAETELRQSHQMFLTVLDGIDATVYVADMHSHEILFMNKNMIDTFGGDFTGRLCYAAFRGESGPCGNCNNDRLLDANGQPTGVCVWEAKNPITGKWYINHDRAIRWLDGRMVRLQIAFNVTHIKEIEQESKRIGEQLIQAQKMESVGRLAGGVAHDFNNMLGAILGYTELGMMEVSPTDPTHGLLKDIQKAAQRSVDLTRQLLAFARKQTVAPKVIDLNKTLEGMLKMLRRLIGENIDLTWLPGKDLGPVRIDPSQIEQLLANLCVNARDAIRDTGKITVETSAVTFDETHCATHVGSVPGEYVLLAVSDNGCGMDPETRSHLFEPFFTTKKVGKGTGLGLATVYGMVKQNNGFIDVYTEPGQGTTFKIYLPRDTAEAGRITKMDAAQPAARGRETILLVEDEPMILDITVKILERQGYTVMAASTPGEAIRLAREHAGEIHLLMTDVVMPEMNGKDLAKNLLSLYPNLKRLFMSGYTADIIAHHGVLDEGVHFIQKPFSVKKLAGQVREVLDETK
jgi:two-component system cell cycle sensor histidine kinase/response regulator CckA